jgi:hypothetical protein
VEVGCPGCITIDHMISYTYEATPVPEPAGWAMMIAGFGMIGAGMRRTRLATRSARTCGRGGAR